MTRWVQGTWVHAKVHVWILMRLLGRLFSIRYVPRECTVRVFDGEKHGVDNCGLFSKFQIGLPGPGGLGK